MLVGELDGRPVATAQVTWQRRMMYGAGLVCQIESVRVLSHLRGQGLGRELIEWIIADARQRGCARVELTSNANRVGARRFYEGLGIPRDPCRHEALPQGARVAPGYSLGSQP